MSQSSKSTSTPIPLLIVGRTRPIALQQSASLAPHFTYTAILDQEHYSPSNVRFSLEILSPTPLGIVVGGGLNVEVQEEVKKLVEELNSGVEEGKRLKLVCIPVGIREKVGAEGLLKWLKDELAGEFGVSW